MNAQFTPRAFHCTIVGVPIIARAPSLPHQRFQCGGTRLRISSGLTFASSKLLRPDVAKLLLQQRGPNCTPFAEYGVPLLLLRWHSVPRRTQNLHDRYSRHLSMHASSAASTLKTPQQSPPCRYHDKSMLDIALRSLIP